MTLLKHALVVTAGLALSLNASAGSMPDLKDAMFVCKATGSNKNNGTKDKPYKNIDKAAKKAKSGQTIAVCEGEYSGTFDIGFVEFKKAFKLYGGFNPDFSKRDVVKHATIFAPNNASGAKGRKALFKFTSEVKGAVLDGFILDMGQRNSYHSSKGKLQG